MHHSEKAQTIPTLTEQSLAAITSLNSSRPEQPRLSDDGELPLPDPNVIPDDAAIDYWRHITQGKK